MSRKHPTLELTEPFQSYLDSIPGAVFQMVTSSEGLVIEYPYIGEGCYKLLEITKSPTSDTALRVPHIQESESSQAHRFPTEQPSGATGKLFEALHKDDRAHFGLALARAVKTPHLWTWEGRISLANGKTKLDITDGTASVASACRLPVPASNCVRAAIRHRCHKHKMDGILLRYHSLQAV